MLIGILSDTHGDVRMARKAVHILQDRGAAYFIHCGDVGGAEVLDTLAGLPAAFVWGNNDWDRVSLDRYARDIGVECLGTDGILQLDGKQVAVLHGDDAALKKQLLDQQQADYLLQGHTHVKADRRMGRTRLINPGALHRASAKTVAILDTSGDALDFIEVVP